MKAILFIYFKYKILFTHKTSVTIICFFYNFFFTNVTVKQKMCEFGFYFFMGVSHFMVSKQHFKFCEDLHCVFLHINPFYWLDAH